MTAEFLLERKTQLLAMLGEKAPARDEIACVRSADAVDQSLINANRIEKEKETSRISERRRDIAAALQRIKEDCYGICVDCDTPIALRRLVLIPQAARCVACQQRAEEEERNAPR